jgi:hypothetical protein
MASFNRSVPSMKTSLPHGLKAPPVEAVCAQSPAVEDRVFLNDIAIGGAGPQAVCHAGVRRDENA